jgi:hypothetical protein
VHLLCLASMALSFACLPTGATVWPVLICCCLGDPAGKGCLAARQGWAQQGGEGGGWLGVDTSTQLCMFACMLHAAAYLWPGGEHCGASGNPALPTSNAAYVVLCCGHEVVAAVASAKFVWTCFAQWLSQHACCVSTGRRVNHRTGKVCLLQFYSCLSCIHGMGQVRMSHLCWLCLMVTHDAMIIWPLAASTGRWLRD